MRKLSVLAFVIVLSTAMVSAQDSQTITLESGETRSIDVAGSHEVTLRYVDGGAALSIDGTDSVYYDGSFGDSEDKFIVNGLVAEIKDFGYSPGYADISFYSLGDTLTLYDRETVQFEQDGEVNTLKLNYVDGGASVTLNGEETPLGEELQTGDSFSAGGATIEVEQTGYEGQDGFMEFKIQGISGDSRSEMPLPVLSMPDRVSVGEEFEVSSHETEDPDGGEITDSLAHVTTEGYDMTLWNVEGLGSETYSFNEPGEYTIRLYVEDDEGESAETTEDITVASVVRPELGEEFEVSKGDRVGFGPDDVNSFKVDSVNSDLVNIVPESDKADTGITERVGIVDFMDIEFESGLYRVSVVERGGESATMKLVRSYSSDFSCEDYETGENEYKFCTNQGDEAVKEVDLGYGRSVDLNFVNNYYINDRKHTTLAGPEKTLRITHGEGQEYRGAEITVEEWRGLQRDEDYEAIIEVNIPEKEPEAWLEFEKNSYTSGERASLTAVAEQDGLYSIEVEGPGIDRQTEIDSGESTIEFQPNGEGTLKARAIAPGTWWNPLNNDRVVDTASAEVREPVKGENHRFGEKFTIQEGETARIEDHNFYLNTVSPVDITWRSSEDVNTNSGLVHLKKVDSMGLQYSDSFEAYGAVCSIDSEAGTAEIIVKQERFNPWNACDKHPSEFRSSGRTDYEINDYELGDKVTLEEGEGLEFGESRAYLREIERFDNVFINDGNLEWIGETSYWNPPSEGRSTTNYFYEGKIATATCEASESQLTLVMEEVGEISGQREWPEDWCSTGEIDDYQVELDCETAIEPGEEARCYVDRFDGQLGEIEDYSWDKAGPGQLDLQDQSVEHIAFYAPEEVSEAETATIHYSATDEQGNTAYSSTEINISEESRRCTYDLYGEVENALESDVPRDEKKVYAGNRFTTLTAEGTFGWTVTSECGSEIEVEYRESGQELTSTTVNLPKSGASVDGIEMAVEREGGNIQPEISVSSEEIDVFEGVDLKAYPEGDYTYRWDLNADNQYERDGRTVSHEWSTPGMKDIRLKVETGKGEFTRERSLRVTGREVDVIKSCGFSREGYDAAGIEAEGPRLTATLEDSVDAPYNQFDIFWKVKGQDIGEKGGVDPGSALPAVEPYLDNLEPGRYSLNAVARAGGNYLDNQSCGSLTVREESDLSPEIGVTPADPKVLEAVTLEAEPAGDYSYSWDLNSDGQYERTGREVTTEYESPGSKNVKLRISTGDSEFETERTLEVENPEVSSSLDVSKEEITPLEPVQISYEVSEAIAENGYSLQIRSPSGEKVLEVSESTTSGGREFIPSRDAETGTYRAKMIASEGFLSSILRVVFGPEAEKEFEVIDASGELDRWRNYCQENGFDPLTASGRISCVKQLVGPECFKENPGQECIEIAESTCDYYVGTGFNPEEGGCRE